MVDKKVASEGMDVSKIVELLSNLTISEANELVRVLGDKWGVSAMAPVAVAAGASSAAAAEKDEFDIMIESMDAASKISLIKEVRSILSLGLVEAQAYVNALPKVLKQGISKAEAEELKKKIEEAGGKVTIK